VPSCTWRAIRPCAPAAGGRVVVISQGLPIYVALEPVEMRMSYERLGELPATRTPDS
jgi:hypothetical protein